MTIPGDEASPLHRRSAREIAATIGQADRDRRTACRTLGVVSTSVGVLKGQKAQIRRGRSVALAAIVVLVLCLGPLVWLVTDHFNSGGHLGDLATQCDLWICILCPALVAAALIGWLRRRS